MSKINLGKLLFSTLLFLLGVHARTTEATLGTQPNIVFVLADDLGWNDTSINGSTFYHTPSLERLAQRGIRLTQAYTENPLCSPTRASILTGQSPARLRFSTPVGHNPLVILDPIIPEVFSSASKLRTPQSATRLKNEYITYAETLEAAGYATAFMGKWHIGMAPYIPDNQGFGTVVGGRHHPGPPGGYFAPFSSDSNLPAAEEGTHVNDLLTDEALDFIQENRNQPFLLNLWFYDVHSPFESKADLRSGYLGESSDDGRQKCAAMGAMVETMDTGLGRVMDRIDQLGLSDKTIIIFYSDNGGNMYNWADNALPTHNWPLRQGKGSMYEGGCRVPCVVVWPGKTTPGSTSDELIAGSDFYPTLLEMAGLAPDPAAVLDGISQTALLQGGSSARTNLFCHFPHRVPDTGAFPGCWVRQGDWKLIRYFHDGPGLAHRYELYNLAADPHEMNNLAGQNQDIVDQLDQQIGTHLAEVDALVPVPNSAYIPPFHLWTPNVQAQLRKGGQGKLFITSNGFEPKLTSPDGLSVLGTPAKVVVEMQSRSYGDGRIFWRTAGQESFGEAQSKAIHIVHDNSLRTYEIPFNPGGPVEQLCLQPSSDAANTEIASILLLDASGAILESWGWVDSDNDGRSDDLELKEGRNPGSAADFGFEWAQEDDTEGWIGTLIAASGTVHGGALSCASTSRGDPQFRYTITGGLSTSEIPGLSLRMKSSTNAPVQLFFATTASNLVSGAQRLEQNYTNAPGWQTLVFDLSSHPGWNGQTVTKLRLDPTTRANARFELDWIRTSGSRD